MAWWDIYDANAEGRLSPELAVLWKQLYWTDIGPCCVRACADVQTARLLLHSLDAVRESDEIVCSLPSDACPADYAQEIQFLGFEPLYLTQTPFSLLAQYHWRPDSGLASGASRLNRYGLFDEAQDALAYGRLYESLADDIIVEELPLFAESFYVALVGRDLSSAD